MQGKLSIERMCQLAGVSRAGFYRSLETRQPVEAEMELRSAIQQIVLEHKRRYGYRRVRGELRRRGMRVNHKRVARVMREDNLVALTRQGYVVTSDPGHEFEVYLNLAARMKLTGINQLWVADITYIRLHSEYVYLAVVLDAYSRKVVGWQLGRSLTSKLAIAALESALAERQPPAGLVHHSDRGTQYASEEYVSVLKQHRVLPSMSRPANPYDNASCESFMRTLKREEVHAAEYHDLEDLREKLTDFLERYYNRVRLHSALGYRPPAEFEQTLSPEAASGAATMSFFRHTEIYPSDRRDESEKEPAETGSLSHRLDESPASYSLAGCSPAEPASASLAEPSVAENRRTE